MSVPNMVLWLVLRSLDLSKGFWFLGSERFAFRRGGRILIFLPLVDFCGVLSD